MILHRIPTIIL